MLGRPFTQHPAAVGETYGEHLLTALSFGLVMMAGGAACLVHAVLPFLFSRTGSAVVRRLHERMVTHRRKGELQRLASEWVI
jgi:hypothetical protein